MLLLGILALSLPANDASRAAGVTEAETCRLDLRRTRPDMILDNCGAPAGHKSCLKASLPTGTDGNGCEAAAEGGGEGLPEGGDGPRGAGHGDWRPPVTWWRVICCQEATDRPARGLVYKSPHYHNGLLPHCISRLSHHKDYCLLLMLTVAATEKDKCQCIPAA